MHNISTVSKVSVKVGNIIALKKKIFANICIAKQKQHRIYFKPWNKRNRKGQQNVLFQAFLNDKHSEMKKKGNMIF